MRKCQSIDRLSWLKIGVVSLVSGSLASLFWPQVALAVPPSPLNPASEEARHVANLYWFTFWIALAIFIVVEGLLLYAVIRFRQKDPRETPPKIHGSTPLEIAWTVAPALVLLIVFVLMIRTMNAAAKPPADAMQIKVIGHPISGVRDYHR
jgi:cytochrome c oxidase subunit 2